MMNELLVCIVVLVEFQMISNQKLIVHGNIATFPDRMPVVGVEAMLLMLSKRLKWPLASITRHIHVFCHLFHIDNWYIEVSNEQLLLQLLEDFRSNHN